MQTHGQQRVPAHLEKPVLPPDSFYPQQLLPHPRQLFFDLSLRWFIDAVRVRLTLRPRQPFPIQLPVRRQRQFLHGNEGRRHHVLRQYSCQMGAQHPRQFSCICLLSCDHIRHQPLLSTLILSRDYHRLPHALMLRQPRLNLSQLNPESTDLHLMIIPPQELDVPVRQVAAQVTGPIHPSILSAPERISQKPFCRQFRTIQVSSRHSRATYIDLSHGSQRHRPLLLIQQIDLRVRDRPPDAVPVSLISYRAEGRVDRRLGRAIGIHQCWFISLPSNPLPHGILLNTLAAHHNQSDALRYLDFSIARH